MLHLVLESAEVFDVREIKLSAESFHIKITGILGITMQDKLTDFCSDAQLVELIEHAKSSEDLLDLLTPYENQHSDLLAWCFNAREGHGQGDGILKDFLLALFHAATDEIPGDKISGKGLTREFVKLWPPSRIVTTSFATTICYREYVLPPLPGDTTKMRLDLLIIDTDNRLVIVIENKAGAKFREGQLKGYLDRVQKSLLAKAAFAEFVVAYAALDVNFEADREQPENDNFDRGWVNLNYEWLTSGAKRAEFSVGRGNQSAALLLSYCRRQTGWESEAMKTVTRLARDLAIRYPEVIEQLKKVSTEFRSPDMWTSSLILPSSKNGQLLKLYMQNEIALNKLFELSPLQLLHAQICEHYPSLEEDEDNTEYGRNYRNYRLPVEQIIPMKDYHWPFYMHIRHIDHQLKDKLKIRILVRWRPTFVLEEDRNNITEKITALSIFKSNRNIMERKKGGVIMEANCLSISEAEKIIKSIFEVISHEFRAS